MKHALKAAAAAALLALAGAAQAALITFNDPSQPIDIDPVTNVATYAEVGFLVSGQAAEFLIIDEALIGGGTGTGPLSLTLAGGGLFALLSLDYGYFDVGTLPGDLTLTGLRGGSTVATRTLSLGTFTSAMFDSNWTMLSEVRFSASSGFTLDNINAVPEPASVTLAALGLAGLAGASTWRRRQQARSTLAG